MLAYGDFKNLCCLSNFRDVKGDVDVWCEHDCKDLTQFLSHHLLV